MSETLIGHFYIILVVGLPVLVLAVPVAYLSWVLKRKPTNSPASFFINSKGASPGRRVVVCAGDSLTHGSMSFNYLELLSARLENEGFQFVNAGVNGDRILDLLARAGEIVACESECITVLIGTNDVLAYLKTRLMKEYDPAHVSIHPFRTHLHSLISEFKKKTRARLALLSIPVIGGDLDGEENVCVKAFNQVVRALANEERIAYLPLFENQAELLASRKYSPRKLPQGRFSRTKILLEHYLLGRSWEDIASSRGYLLTTDGIHMSSSGARMIADLIEDFLMTPDRRPGVQAGDPTFSNK